MMPFSEPIINEGGAYKAQFVTDPSVVGASAHVVVTLSVGEEEWSGPALDALFQELVDMISESVLFQFQSAAKAQNTSTMILPTE